MIGSYGDLNNKEQVVALIDEVRNNSLGMRHYALSNQRFSTS